MEPRRVAEGVDWVGAVDWDRRLFDELIPLPDGTSYNAYLVRGSEKTALVDAVDPPMTEVLLSRLRNSGVKTIDYVVANHAEQDHSGAIPRILELHPEATVLATPKCRAFLMDLLHLPAQRVREVADGETVSLGDRTLRFIHFPWVHWPETMLTWVPESKVLLSCDLFGSHLASSELFAADGPAALAGAKRYYAEIMMPFRGFIEKNLPKVEALGAAAIAPSHGPVWGDPKLIIDAYKDWMGSPPKNLAIVAYVSMHESTRRMAEHLSEALVRRGVAVELFNLTHADVGKLAMALVDASTVALGSPTVLMGAHPKAAEAAYLVNLLKPKAKYLAVFGSYGWGGKMVEQLGGMLANLKAEVLPPVLVKGLPKPADFAALDKLAEDIRARHQAL